MSSGSGGLTLQTWYSPRGNVVTTVDGQPPPVGYYSEAEWNNLDPKPNLNYPWSSVGGDSSGGSSSGNGTTNYNQLTNRPLLNGSIFQGSMTTTSLGLATAAQGAKADTALQSADANTYYLSKADAILAYVKKAELASAVDTAVEDYIDENPISGNFVTTGALGTALADYTKLDTFNTQKTAITACMVSAFGTLDSLTTNNTLLNERMDDLEDNVTDALDGGNLVHLSDLDEYVKTSDLASEIDDQIEDALADYEPGDLANYVKVDDFEALEGEVDDLKADLANSVAAVSTLETYVEDELDTLDTAITTMAADITANYARVADVEDLIDEALEDYEPTGDMANYVTVAALEEDYYDSDEADSVMANVVTIHNNSALSHNEVESRTQVIEGKIPDQASKTNQLGDKNFINSSVASLAAWKLYKSAIQDDFDTAAEFNTLAALETATNNVFYRADGQLHHSSPNDYVLITADELHNNGNPSRWKNFLQADGTTTVWGYDMPLGGAFTADQLAAIDSGVTEEIVEGVKNLPKHVAFVTTPDYAKLDTTNKTPTKTTTWTVDRKGFIKYRVYSGTASDINLLINNATVVTNSYSSGGVIPVEVGDVIKYSGSSGFEVIQTNYIPPRYSPVAAAFALAPNGSAQDTTNQMPGDTDTYTVAQSGFVNVTRTGDAGSPQTIYLDGVAVAVGLGTVSFYENVDEGSVVSWSGDGFVSGSCFYVPPKFLPVNRGYSTDEQLTGETWIDGKPIFRRTKVVTVASITNGAWLNIIDFGLPNAVDALVEIRTVCDYAGGDVRPMPYTSSSPYAIRFWRPTGFVQIYTNTGAGALGTITCTLTYTKK